MATAGWRAICGTALDGNVNRTCEVTQRGRTSYDGDRAGWGRHRRTCGEVGEDHNNSLHVTASEDGAAGRAMGRHGRFNSKIFESAHHFRIESNRAADSNSNRISKLCRSLFSSGYGLHQSRLQVLQFQHSSQVNSTDVNMQALSSNNRYLLTGKTVN